MIAQKISAFLLVTTLVDCSVPVAPDRQPETGVEILPPGSTEDRGSFSCVFSTTAGTKKPHLTYQERRPSQENPVSMIVTCANGVWRFTCPANQYRLFFDFGNTFSLGPFLTSDPEPLFTVYPQEGVKTRAHVACNQKSAEQQRLPN